MTLSIDQKNTLKQLTQQVFAEDGIHENIISFLISPEKRTALGLVNQIPGRLSQAKNVSSMVRPTEYDLFATKHIGELDQAIVRRRATEVMVAARAHQASAQQRAQHEAFFETNEFTSPPSRHHPMRQGLYINT